MKKRRYDYVSAVYGDVQSDMRGDGSNVKRILRRLVRKAAMMGHGEIDNLGTLDEQKSQADRIAKELVP